MKRTSTPDTWSKPVKIVTQKWRDKQIPALSYARFIQAVWRVRHGK